MQPRKIDALGLNGIHHVIDIHLAGIFDLHGNAHQGACGHGSFFSLLEHALDRAFKTAFGDKLLDFVFHGIRQFETLSVEEFNAVVLRRIMRSGDDDAAVGVQLARKQRHGGRGNHSGKQSVATGAGDARNNWPLPACRRFCACPCRARWSCP